MIKSEPVKGEIAMTCGFSVQVALAPFKRGTEICCNKYTVFQSACDSMYRRELDAVVSKVLRSAPDIKVRTGWSSPSYLRYLSEYSGVVPPDAEDFTMTFRYDYTGHQDDEIIKKLDAEMPMVVTRAIESAGTFMTEWYDTYKESNVYLSPAGIKAVIREKYDQYGTKYQVTTYGTPAEKGSAKRRNKMSMSSALRFVQDWTRGIDNQECC